MALADSTTFRSLRVPAYRTWALGAIVSNVGTWMQRTAQDWLVLMELTDRSATAVGVVMSLQFGPQVLFLPLTGFVADHVDRRKVMLATQSALGLLALGLGVLTIGGWVKLWHVYVFAFLLGTTTAFDVPARQTFVSDLVDERDLPNAVALNSTSFNAARLIGPAAAGLLIAKIGTGWVFVANGLSFAAVIVSLWRLRGGRSSPRATRGRGSLVEGFRYVWRRGDLRLVLSMLFFVGTFGLNFPIFISTMATTTFGKGAGQFGLLTSIMAIGSVTGALLAARRAVPRVATLTIGALSFGVATGLAALAPSYVSFAIALIAVGTSAQTFTVTTNSFVQITTASEMRGRVMAILMAVILGCTPLGAPLIGRISDTFGPRWAMGAGALSGIVAAAVGALVTYRRRRAPRSP